MEGTGWGQGRERVEGQGRERVGGWGMGDGGNGLGDGGWQRVAKINLNIDKLNGFLLRTY